MNSASATHSERLLRAVEAVGVFALGVAVMSYLYAASVAIPGDEIGVPEHDSYYHVAMAAMLPEYGLLGKFPWLQYSYFRDAGDDFVSHHWGFHLLLMPFVKASQWLVGDALAGGRWAMCAVFGGNLLLFHLLLRQRRVPWHWLWIALFLLLPDQFFARQGYVRAIGASLLFMQLLLLALFAGRYWLAALTLAAYVHLYLGAVMYGPVIVGLVALATVVGPRTDRRWPWKMVLVCAAGWLVGIATYPYSAGMFEFLRMQVFGTGLTPDIEVGREWKPYTDPWFVVTMAAPLLVVWVGSLVARLRMGPRLDARDTAMVLIQFAFLMLTLKARRFIEYWPPFCLLSAAYIAAAPLSEVSEAARRWWAARSNAVRGALSYARLAAIAVAVIVTGFVAVRRADGVAILAEWRMWLAVTALLTLPALTRIWVSGSSAGDTQLPIGRLFGVALGGVALVTAGFIGIVVLTRMSALPNPRLSLTGFGVGLLVAAFGLIPLVAAGLRSETPARTWRLSSALNATMTLVLFALLVPTVTLAASAGRIASASRQVKCYYDLAEVRAVMSFLQQDSHPGDIVFTDDWDIFPVFFYHNRSNHYIVGLDPKFTHQRQPELWDRYVKVSRGEVPATIRTVSRGGERGTKNVALADIREYFKARYVVADRDHRRLADRLAAAPELAEFVYPGATYANAKSAEYVVFRIRDAAETVAECASVQAHGL